MGLPLARMAASNRSEKCCMVESFKVINWCADFTTEWRLNEVIDVTKF